MATAGCGDVLTGLIAAFLAQGLKHDEAALLGVYVHAMAGEHAAHLKTSYGVVASDVIEAFAAVFQELIDFHQ
jgi:ADP-dependent NAD(P)H-hydrate dehydratase / NAD(P)H-hydrate epimerase